MNHMIGSDEKISEQVKAALDRIKQLDSAKSLRRYYDNVIVSQKISDYERELLVDALESRMRVVSSSTATKLFGQKDNEARKFLQKTYDDLSKTFDLSANRVKPGAKVGGDMIKGDIHIDLYISYKNTSGLSVGLSWLQETAGSERYLKVKFWKSGGEDRGTRFEQRFEAGQEDPAVACFKEALTKIIP